MYTNTYHNFHKNLIHYPRIFNGNSNSVVTNHIDFQIHKPLAVSHHDQGVCCCSGQLAGEKLRQHVLPQNKPSVGLSVAYSGDRGCLGTLSSMKSEVAYHHYGEAECILPTVSRHKAKSRQRTGSRSSKPPTSWSQVIGIA